MSMAYWYKLDFWTLKFTTQSSISFHFQSCWSILFCWVQVWWVPSPLPPYQWRGSECISRVCGPRGPECPLLMEYEDIAKQVLANTQMLSIPARISPLNLSLNILGRFLGHKFRLERCEGTLGVMRNIWRHELDHDGELEHWKILTLTPWHPVQDNKHGQ